MKHMVARLTSLRLAQSHNKAIWTRMNRTCFIRRSYLRITLRTKSCVTKQLAISQYSVLNETIVPRDTVSLVMRDSFVTASVRCKYTLLNMCHD